MNTDMLLKIKKDLEALEEKNRDSEIKKELILEQLKDNWGINSIEEASIELKKLESKCNMLDTQFQKKYNEFIEEIDDLGIL